MGHGWCHAGGIATGLQRYVDLEALMAASREAGASDVLTTTQQRAATSVLLAVSPLLEGVGDRCSEDCHEAPVIGGRDESDGRHGVAPLALDPENAARLWTVSEGLLSTTR